MTSRIGPSCLLVAATLAMAGCEAESEPAPTAKPRGIIGETTQDIRPAAPEIERGAKVSRGEITAKDPITIHGNAYVSTVGKLAVMQVDQAIQTYHALNDAYPKDFAEFKKEIIEANNIQLPQLPDYQAYGYDEKAHKLVVLEYPDRKAPRPEGQ